MKLSTTLVVAFSLPVVVVEGMVTGSFVFTEFDGLDSSWIAIPTTTIATTTEIPAKIHVPRFLLGRRMRRAE